MMGLGALLKAGQVVSGRQNSDVLPITGVYSCNKDRDHVETRVHFKHTGNTFGSVSDFLVLQKDKEMNCHCLNICMLLKSLYGVLKSQSKVIKNHKVVL